MGLFSENGFQNFRQWFSENAFGENTFQKMLLGISDNTFGKWRLRVLAQLYWFFYL
jgi:hypothetical protein